MGLYGTVSTYRDPREYPLPNHLVANTKQKYVLLKNQWEQAIVSPTSLSASVEAYLPLVIIHGYGMKN